MCKINRYYAQINNDCAFPLVPALDAGPQKAGHIHLIDMAGFNAIPRQAWELYGFDLFYRDITDLFNRCLSFSR